MPKINLTDLSNLQNEASATAAINHNNSLIEAAIDNSISRDGTQPNQMNSDLDMNSNKIINLPNATSDQEPVTYGQYLDGITSVNNGAVIDGSFVTLGTNPTLLNERVLTAGPAMQIVDGGPGSNVVVGLSSQELTAIAGAGSDVDKITYYDAIGSAELTDLSPFARTLLDDIDAVAARATLGVSTGSGDLVAANNLSDVANTTTARNNLGAGTGDGDMLGSNNLSDVSDANIARTNIGAGDMVKANNLSDVTNTSTARNNLSAFGKIVIQNFTSSGTYTPTSNMKYCVVEAVGGGGGGGGSTYTTNYLFMGGGGAGGSYSKKVFTASDIGASKAVVIGAGGTGSTGDGGAGGDTTLGTTLLIAKGGGGGFSTTLPGGVHGGTPSSGGTGDVVITGEYGHNGWYSTGGITNFVGAFGRGGSSKLGSGAKAIAAGMNLNTVGNPAVANTGGGGSGAATLNGNSAVSGGAGGSGRMIIYEFCSS